MQSSGTDRYHEHALCGMAVAQRFLLTSTMLLAYPSRVRQHWWSTPSYRALISGNSGVPIFVNGEPPPLPPGRINKIIIIGIVIGLIIVFIVLWFLLLLFHSLLCAY